MCVNRMAAGICALFCAVVGTLAFDADSAEAKSAVASRTATVERQLTQLQQLQHRYRGALRFWHNPKRRWMLHLRYKNRECWRLPLKGPVGLCLKSRASVRLNNRRLQDVEARIVRLSTVLRVLRNYYNWSCIHHNEGDWQDGGWPYVGGLQMNEGFVRTYAPDMIRKYGWPRFSRSGPNGWLNAWTAEEQMMVAQRAYDGFAGYGPRGFHPWPNTARECGLL